MNDLMQFTNGMTNYVAAHNSNYQNIKAAIESLEVSQQAQAGAAVNPVTAFSALFGSAVAVIGAGSYKCTGAGSTLTVAPGFAWIPSSSAVVSLAAAQTLSFAGLAAGTYYVVISSAGVPSRADAPLANTLYSVEWTGSAFGAITRLAAVVWGAADQIAAQSNAALGQSFDSLDAILEAIASSASAGAKPYIPEIKDVAYAASSTADFSDADVIRITLAGNPTITLAGGSDGQKCILELKQDATGSRTVTWGANVRFGSDLPSITLSTAGGALDRVGLIYNAAGAKYDVVALSRGF